jgi:hypothetical protein
MKRAAPLLNSFTGAVDRESQGTNFESLSASSHSIRGLVVTPEMIHNHRLQAHEMRKVAIRSTIAAAVQAVRRLLKQ